MSCRDTTYHAPSLVLHYYMLVPTDTDSQYSRDRVYVATTQQVEILRTSMASRRPAMNAYYSTATHVVRTDSRQAYSLQILDVPPINGKR